MLITSITGKGFNILKEKKSLLFLLFLIFFIWWLIAELGLVSTFRLPRLFDVVSEMFRPPYLIQIKVTAIEVMVGFALGIIAGVSIGTLTAYSARAERALSPVVLFFSSIKKGTLAPIFVVWLGYGMSPLVVVAALVCFFPIVVNTLDGLTLVEPTHLEMMRSIQSSKWQIFKKLRFPNALPQIFSGLKVAAPLTVIGAVVAELFAGNTGLGYQVVRATSEMNMPLMFGALLWMGIIGMTLYALILVLERLSKPWYLRTTSS